MSEDKYSELRDSLSETWDLAKLGGLAAWDQQTMMPPTGGPVRAQQLGTVSKLIHARMVSEELGDLLEELRPYEESLDYDSDEASLIRVTRRDRDKELRVPADLREAQTLAGAEAFPVWVEARAKNDFELFRPYLERNIALRREYASCFEVDEPYDALLDDFEPGMKTQEVRDVFTRVREGLVPLVAELAAQEVDDSCLLGDFPVERQREMQMVLLERFGFREGGWRLDPVAHPFASSMATTDIRMTTYYPAGEMRGIFAAMHEGGHGLYEHNVDPALERTPLCRGTSLALHESQSRMFENLVGRSIQWWRWAYPEMQRIFPAEFGGVDLETFHRAINKVQPSLIRIEADEATYSLHIILRFELEQELISGAVEPRDLPSRLERAHARVPRRRGARRRARRPAGRPLVARDDRLLPDLCPRQRDLGADLGQGAGGRAGPVRAHRARRPHSADGLAAREALAARPQVHAAGDTRACRRRRHGSRAVPPVSERQARRARVVVRGPLRA